MMRRLSILVVVVAFGVVGCAAGAGEEDENGDPPPDNEPCPGVASWTYDADADECVQRSCGQGDYNTPSACREDNGLTEEDAGLDVGMTMDTGVEDIGGTDDTGSPEDTEVPEDTGDEPADVAADSGDEPTDVAPDTGGGEDTSGTDAEETGTSDSGTDTSDTSTDSGQQDAGDSCSSRGLSSCFSNYDCASNERCEELGTESDPLKCCTTGSRGSKSAGEDCTTDRSLACESGVCVNNQGSSTYYCSKECEQDSECPSNVSTCTSLFGVSSKWCLP
jgi:hypothetical protein